MNTYSHLTQLLQNELKSYSSSLKNEPAQLYDPIRYMLAIGGKRLRPLFALIACDMFDENPEKAISVATAVELFHNFSLIHDDIMDRAPLRRGQSTVHEKWNSNIAILSGDAVLVKAYEELSQAEIQYLPQLLHLFNTTALQVCEGQQYDMDFEKKSIVSIDDYLNMITLKTAVLLGCSLQMGAIAANTSPKNAQLLYDFGKHFGIAFQLKDDLLDVYGDTLKVGKQTGGDIISNKKTFLLLKALQKADSKQRKKLNDWLQLKEFDTSKKVQAIKTIFEELKVYEATELEIQHHFQKALSFLEDLDCSSIKKQQLSSFAKELMQREY